MTLEELRDRIDNMIKANPRSAENIVGIPDLKFKGMGGYPIDPIKYINNGFDWNKGYSMIVTESQHKKTKQ